MLLERAENDKQRAFAYGYLTHLAGDVFSHNHYIPTQLIVSYRTRTLRHIYWEARFDSQQESNVRDIIRDLRRGDFSECDALVENVISRTLFSFRIDKRIFDSFIAIHDLDQWHQIMSRLVNGSRFGLPQGVVDQYNGACFHAIGDVLVNGQAAACQTADPTGLEALILAKQVRRNLKVIDRRGAMPAKLLRQIDQLDRKRGLHHAGAAELGTLLGP